MRALAVGLLLLIAPGAASAQERLTIEWTGPAECGGPGEVRGEVTRLLGGEIPSDGAPIVARAHAATRSGGFSLELRTETDGVEGVRSLNGADCAELVDACGLILAMMIDPEAALAAPTEDAPTEDAQAEDAQAEDAQAEDARPVARPEVRSLARQLSSPSVVDDADVAVASEAANGRAPRDEPTSASAGAGTRARAASDPSEGEPATSEGVASADAPSADASSADASSADASSADASSAESAGPAERPTFFFGAGGLLDLTTLPQVSGGPFVDVGLGGPLVEGRLRITFLAPQSALEETREVGAELMALGAAGRVCVRPIEDARWFGGCAGVELGAIFGRGFGVSDPSFGAGFWMGGTLGVGLAWRALEWLDLSVDADLVIPFVDSVFSVVLPDGVIDVFVPEDVGGRLSLSLHGHFAL